jgi:cysteinyl-tRNA synthetase
MKNLLPFLILSLAFISCPGPQDNRDYRQDMRDFVENISVYAKQAKPGFLIVPQNGHDLFTEDGESVGTPDTAYLDAIDGEGREDLFYGYTADNQATPDADKNEMIAFLDIAEANSVQALVTDYCSTTSKMDDSYTQNQTKGYISFAADHRELDNIPTYPVPIHNMNMTNISSLSAAKNFLYIINTAEYPSSKQDFLDALKATAYDLLIIDLYYTDTEILTATDIVSLKTKASGGSRLVLAYMSIGEAEDYRYYWKSSWKTNRPAWLAGENADWPGNYKVRYWMKEWQDIIYGKDNSYAKKIIDAGFDGAYLDIIDAYEYFE